MGFQESVKAMKQANWKKKEGKEGKMGVSKCDKIISGGN